MKDNRIRCNSCGHICTEKQLLIVEGIEHCPHCGTSGFLINMRDVDLRNAMPVRCLAWNYLMDLDVPA